MPEARERREEPRTPVRSLEITLHEQGSGDMIGAVANISPGGLLLNSMASFAVNATHQVRLDWRQPDAPGADSMVIGITAMWSAPADNGEACWTGFQIIDISDADLARLHALINDEAS